MDALFFHPKVVHLPIALSVLMPVIAGAVAFAWWRKWVPARVWVLAVALQAVLVASGFIASQTGEREEERVEAVVAEQFIEAHEEAAEVFIWASGAVLALMVAGLLTARRRPGLPLAAVAVAGTLVVLGLGYRTGEAGGALVYTHGAASAYVQAGGGDAAAAAREGGEGQRPAKHDDDDDDDD